MKRGAKGSLKNNFTFYTPYIDLSAKESSESREVSPGVVLDYDKENNLVGIDIDNASRKLDLKELI